MPLLAGPRRFGPRTTRRPQYLLGLNRASPQATGLALWTPVIGDAPDRLICAITSVVFPRGGAGSGVLTIGKGELGPYFQSDGATNAFLAGATSPWLLTNKHTLAVWARSVGTNRGPIIALSFGATLSSLAVTGVTLADAGQIFRTVHNTTLYSSGHTMGTNAWTHLAYTTDGTSTRQYVNGRLVATHTVTAPTPNGSVALLGHGSLANASANLQMFDARGYNRVLSDGEIRALWEPQTRWDLYAQPTFATSFPTATLSGTALDAITEGDLVASGKTLIITLSGDTWIPA